MSTFTEKKDSYGIYDIYRVGKDGLTVEVITHPTAGGRWELVEDMHILSSPRPKVLRQTRGNGPASVIKSDAQGFQEARHKWNRLHGERPFDPFTFEG
jgi:hypothetical protein